jgi:hypothetical protein
MARGFLGKSDRETAAYVEYVRISSELLTTKAPARFSPGKKSKDVSRTKPDVQRPRFLKGEGYKTDPEINPFHISKRDFIDC